MRAELEAIASRAEQLEETVEVRLSSRGLENVPFELHEKDFEFVVGKEHIGVSSFVAEFLSPKICRLRRSDAAFCRYFVETRDVNHCFDRFLSAGRGSDLHIDRANASFFISLFLELENEELFSNLVSSMERTELTAENAVSQLMMKRLCFSEMHCDRELDFVASHFFEIPEQSLSKLDSETLARVLSRDCLKIESEDRLYAFIRHLIDEDASNCFLLEFVLFEFLSESSIRSFAGESDEFVIGHLSVPVWRQICRRLVLAPKLDDSSASVGSRYCRVVPNFPLDESQPLNGIIAHLTRTHGGNVSDTGVVGITADRPYSDDPSDAAKNVADLGTDSYFQSDNVPNRWISFDFKDRRITPTAYSIRPYSAGPGNHHLKSWVIEVSNDGKDWTEVDRRENNSDLNDNRVTRSFRTSRQEECRFIRLRQIGKNHYGNDFLRFTSFEIFGLLRE